MSLLTPLTGLIAALIVVPLLVALYMLKLRRTRRDISSTLLWKSHTEDVRANTLMQRLRLTPLFLLQLLLLLLLACALMQPVLAGWTRPGGRMVLFIDQSASMQTRDAPNDATLPRVNLCDCQSLRLIKSRGVIWRIKSLHAG